jgi:hypothetical protein
LDDLVIKPGEPGGDRCRPDGRATFRMPRRSPTDASSTGDDTVLSGVPRPRPERGTRRDRLDPTAGST